jgi:hypothetical protein
LRDISPASFSKIFLTSVGQLRFALNSASWSGFRAKHWFWWVRGSAGGGDFVALTNVDLVYLFLDRHWMKCHGNPRLGHLFSGACVLRFIVLQSWNIDDGKDVEQDGDTAPPEFAMEALVIL